MRSEPTAFDLAMSRVEYAHPVTCLMRAAEYGAKAAQCVTIALAATSNEDFEVWQFRAEVLARSSFRHYTRAGR